MRSLKSRLRLLLLLLLWTVPALDAQQDPSVKDALSENFQIISLSDGAGWVLIPQSGGDIESLEVRDGVVRGDGELLSPERLQELFGERQAELLQELSLSDPYAEEVREMVEETEAEVENLEERLQELREEERRHEESKRQTRARDSDERRAEERKRRIRRDTHVSFGQSVRVADDESARDVVVIGGSIEVDGHVRGDVVATPGSVEVDGSVDGTVTAVLGSVSLGPKSHIDGDVVSIGGAVDRHPDSRIDGEIIEISVAPMLLELGEIDWPEEAWGDFWGTPWFAFSGDDFVGLVLQTAALLVICMLIVLIGRGWTRDTADLIRREPFKAGLVGLLVEVIFFPVLGIVALVLLISVIGIPVLLVLGPLSILLLCVFFFIGYACAALALGRSILGEARAAWAALFLGVLTIQVWELIAELLTIPGGVIRFLGVLLVLGALTFKYVVWTVGLGGVVMKLSGGGSSQAVPPPPPPPPTDPDHRLGFAEDLAETEP